MRKRGKHYEEMKEKGEEVENVWNKRRRKKERAETEEGGWWEGQGGKKVRKQEDKKRNIILGRNGQVLDTRTCADFYLPGEC